jgi:hypothetical protein
MPERVRSRYEKWGLRDLLKEYPGLSLKPQAQGGALITGDLEFSAQYVDHKPITDLYKVEIQIASDFPRSIPIVKEIGQRIQVGFHTNLPEGTLCLGSGIKLKTVLYEHPTLLGFVENCLIPFLYAYSFREKHRRLPWGDLAHGALGLIHDYMTILNVDSEKACLELIALLGIRKRVANKRPCPCGSGRRVGKCHHRVLNSLRTVASRSWFRGEYRRLSD